MNEPMPQWRSFPPGLPTPPPGGPRPPEDEAPAAPPRWLVPLLAAGGGLLAGVAVVAVVFVALVGPSEPAPSDDFGEALLLAPAGVQTADEPNAVGHILVDVAGAVAQPGLHRLDASARVGDAIEAAGGFGPRADLDAASQALNLAQPLEDGAKVLVPELGHERLPRPAAADGRIDLNSADQAELESLPGVGPVTARKIIEARGEDRFAAVRDLRTRGLVGESVFSDIRDRVSAG